jgi:DNA-directed RNA polymerase I, II, and III subunit RPABC2
MQKMDKTHNLDESFNSGGGAAAASDGSDYDDDVNTTTTTDIDDSIISAGGMMGMGVEEGEVAESDTSADTYEMVGGAGEKGGEEGEGNVSFESSSWASSHDDDDENENDNDDDDDDENHLQKFDNELKKKYIASFHPESLSYNNEETESMSMVTRNDAGIIIDPFHKTLPFLTKYEKTRILGIRTKQLNEGAKPYVDVNPTVIDGYIIAQLELEHKKLPFIIRRPMPNGSSELWRLQDLEIIC